MWPIQLAVLRLIGRFRKIAKTIFSFAVSVCLSVCMERLGSHWTYFHEIWYLSIFSKICREDLSLFKIGQE